MISIISPTTAEEAARLKHLSPASIAMAGGTDLMVRRNSWKEGMSIIALSEIGSMQGVRLHTDMVTIGACTSLSDIAECDVSQKHIPLLCAAIRHMASPQIRNRGTIGGNIMNASPAGDGLAACIALDAQATLLRFDGSSVVRRSVSVAELIVGPGKTNALPDELLYEISIPVCSGSYFYEKIGNRTSMAISIASISMAHDRQGTPRLAVGSCGPKILRIPEAERLLRSGHTAEEAKTAIALILQSIRPIDDIRATAEYRKQVVKNLLEYHYLSESTKA